jgi:hypothetical protein
MCRRHEACNWKSHRPMNFVGEAGSPILGRGDVRSGAIASFAIGAPGEAGCCTAVGGQRGTADRRRRDMGLTARPVTRPALGTRPVRPCVRASTVSSMVRRTAPERAERAAATHCQCDRRHGHVVVRFLSRLLGATYGHGFNDAIEGPTGPSGVADCVVGGQSGCRRRRSSLSVATSELC